MRITPFLIIVIVFAFGCQTQKKALRAERQCQFVPKEYALDSIDSTHQFIAEFSDYYHHNSLHHCLTVIENVRIIDVKAGKASRPSVVVVDHERIDTIIPLQDYDPKVYHEREDVCVRFINGKGKYLSPGLIDMHFHYDCINIQRMRLMSLGITGVRNMTVGEVQSEESSFQGSGSIMGPHIYNVSESVFHLLPKADTNQINTSFYGQSSWIHASWVGMDSTLKHLLASRTIQDRIRSLSLELRDSLPPFQYPPGTVFEQMNALQFMDKADPALGDYWFVGSLRFINSLGIDAKEATKKPENADFAAAVEIFNQWPERFCISTDGRGRGGFEDLMSREMTAWKALGASNAQILRMATLNPGKCISEAQMRMDGDSTNYEAHSPYYFPGEIKEGYRADMLLLQENPLHNLNTLFEPVQVFNNGYYYDQNALSELKRAIKKFE